MPYVEMGPLYEEQRRRTAEAQAHTTAMLQEAADRGGAQGLVGYLQESHPLVPQLSERPAVTEVPAPAEVAPAPVEVKEPSLVRRGLHRAVTWLRRVK